MQLQNLSQQYMDYLGNIGKDSNAVQSLELFAPHCIKVINGAQILGDADAFKAHLTDLRNQSGAWHVNLQDKVLGADDRTCVLRYDIVAEKFGGFHVISILRYRPDGLLQEVNEVFHPTSEPFKIENIEKG